MSLNNSILIVGLLLLAACNTPRGAGFQSEVLANQGVTTEAGEPEHDFALFMVTRDNLTYLDDWPSIGPSRQRWIRGGATSGPLVIRPGDNLAVSIWDANNNSLLTSPGQKFVQLPEVKVGDDGNIFIPFVGKINVEGMTAEAARTHIEYRMTETAPSAQVQVSQIVGRKNTVDLLVGVASPGPYPITDQSYSLLSLLTDGGGVRSNLVNPRVQLMRNGTLYETSLTQVYHNPRLDISLRGGDRVMVVPEDRYFMSLGATQTQAKHIFDKDYIDALSALATIGGLSANRANAKGVLILREYPSRDVGSGASRPPQERVVFSIDLTTADGLFSAGKFEIMPNDLVYGTESPVSSVRTVLALLGAVLGLSG